MMLQAEGQKTSHNLKEMSTVQREFSKTRFSRCMLYRNNAEIGTYSKLVFWYNALYLISWFANFGVLMRERNAVSAAILDEKRNLKNNI